MELRLQAWLNLYVNDQVSPICIRNQQFKLNKTTIGTMKQNVFSIFFPNKPLKFLLFMQQVNCLTTLLIHFWCYCISFKLFWIFEEFSSTHCASKATIHCNVKNFQKVFYLQLSYMQVAKTNQTHGIFIKNCFAC